MDTIDNSHFEAIKNYVKDTGVIFKLRHNKKASVWLIEFVSPYTYHNFKDVSLGKALKQASEWVGEQIAVPKRESKASTLGQTSRYSTPLGEEVRIEAKERDPYDLTDTIGYNPHTE